MKNVRLETLTAPEIDRMRDLYAMAPLGWIPIDDSLRRKGWAAPWDGTWGDVGPSDAAYRKDNGAPCMYGANGVVLDCWKARGLTL